MFVNLLLTLNVLVCLALIGVVLLQRSEGGAFGGGNPTGLVTARGAGDLLTRTTWILFTLFLSLSLALTLLGAHERSDAASLRALRNLRVNPETLRRPATPPAGQAPVGLPPLSSGSAPATGAPGSPAPATAAGGANGLALPPLEGAPAGRPPVP
ncbi:MAG: preprotein translocase subunit SecG [Caulobacteraceae bacterium]